MKTLNAFIKSENAWTAIFSGRVLEIATAKGRQEVAEVIDNKLSPENLTCDGELSRAEVSLRYTQLTRAADELRALDPSVQIYEY
jgi:hypothetical protein